jgi:hypothetical protein
VISTIAGDHYHGRVSEDLPCTSRYPSSALVDRLRRRLSESAILLLKPVLNIPPFSRLDSESTLQIGQGILSYPRQAVSILSFQEILIAFAHVI